MRRKGLKYYRWQADRCRELAEGQSDGDVKARLLGVAQQYAKLAEETKAE